MNFMVTAWAVLFVSFCPISRTILTFNCPLQRSKSLSRDPLVIDSTTIMLTATAPFVGSFISVLVVRLPPAREAFWRRSQRDACGKRLSLVDLFPIVSWMWHRPISRLPLALEIAAIAMALWAASETSGWILLATCILGWLLLTLAVIDFRTFLLPDELTLPMIPAGLYVAYRIEPSSLLVHALAALMCFVGSVVLAFAYRRLRGREGLGLGDAKLLAGLGAWLGPLGVPSAILFAAVLGLAFVLYRSLRGHPIALSDKIPLGTFLAAGGWLVWLYGPLIPSG
ncbi:MAG: prepilin peptidase [Alphaproteobacteria bacterium]|nr:prepilin peptidase [Alphaproteobacteria bacterium]